VLLAAGLIHDAALVFVVGFVVMLRFGIRRLVRMAIRRQR
jgi:hypothetical protein